MKMAIELKFLKPDSTASWGFRLVGGADFKEPLVVVKVNEKSLAENAGLMVGDVLVRINNTSTAGITHYEAHDLIDKAGCELVVAVRRGLFSDIPVFTEEENNNEVKSILEDSIAENYSDSQKDQEIGLPPNSLENLAGQDQLVFPKDNSEINKCDNKPKKFSSFLVKPKNPKPIPKKVPEVRTGEPYKVKIIKQPKRDPNWVLNHKKSVQFEPNVIELEVPREESMADSNESLEISEIKAEGEIDIETSVEVIEEVTVETYDSDGENEQNQISDNVDNDSLENEIIQNEKECIIKKHKSILKPAAPLDIHIDPVICESSLPLEEQLAAVQKQLMALSQLPSAIQVTLEAVTQQLNKIVIDKMKKTEEDENNANEDFENDNDNLNETGVALDEELLEENVSTSENAEGDITDNEAEDNHNFEELEDDCSIINDDNKNIEEPDTSEREKVNDDPYAGLTEEEKNAKIREEQLLAKKQKIEEERRKMDWTQRPIVLPGGRKWSDPDDATPKFKTPKMSDEKISKTIEDYSELLVGKTKGINFLKYQPPPKNLDYLQKSEVYRLIHGMEAPVRGVGARAEKILSEKDYYGDKGAP